MYTLTDTAKTVPMEDFIASRGATQCPVDVVGIVYTKLPDDRTSITENSDNWSIYWDTDDYPLNRQEKVEITVRSNSKYSTTAPPLEVADDFLVQFESPCGDKDLTTITPQQQTDPNPDQYTGNDF